MKISDMVKNVNRLVGYGNYRYVDIQGYLDEVIDEINEELYIALPLITDVYNNVFSYTEEEQELIDSGELIYATPGDEEGDPLENDYRRIPDSYIRNYVCHEVAYRKLSDEDEDPEVYRNKYVHARRWYRRLIAEASNHKLEDTEAVSFNGDVDELEDTSVDDTGIGYYNATSPLLWPSDD